MEYEYRVVPAPKRLRKIKGMHSTPELFAATLTDAINAEARQGWEYVRAESMAAEGPSGWFRRGRVVEETMMIFRRPRRPAPGSRITGEGEPVIARRPVTERAGGQDRTDERTEARMPVAPAPERGRPAAPRLIRGEPPLAPPPEAPRTATTAPLLRPVPRHKPGDKP